MDDEDWRARWLSGFLEDLPNRIEALRRYLDAGDADGTARRPTP